MINDTEQMKNIIDELKNNNLDNFDIFYDLTKRQVYFTIISILKNKDISDEIMQDTYIRFLDNIHKYKDGTNVIAFIVTIARNLSINEFNRLKKQKLYNLDNQEDTYISQDRVDTPLIDLMYKELEGDELQVIVLHVIDELKHKDIAKIMHKPLGTITWLYNKAIKKLKKKAGIVDE